MNGIEKQWNTRQHNTAGLELHYKHTKNLFACDSEGLLQFRDHRWKALGEEKPDLPGKFSVIAKNQADLDSPRRILYSWIADQRDEHEQLICQRTRRITTIPRPPLERSRRGRFRSFRSIFL